MSGRLFKGGERGGGILLDVFLRDAPPMVVTFSQVLIGQLWISLWRVAVRRWHRVDGWVA